MAANDGTAATNPEKEKACYSYALWLLSRRNYSRLKLSKKLESKNYSKSVIKESIQKLENLGLFNEKYYINEKARAWSDKNLSDSMILRRFRYDGIQLSQEELEKIREQLSIRYDSEEQQIESILRREIQKRRISSVPKEFRERRKLEDKLISASFRKGHSPSKAREVLRHLFREIEEES